MVDIRIVGAADFSQVSSQMRALQKQTAALNTELTRTGIAASSINPNGYQKMQAAMRASSQTFRAAAASSGQFYTEQIRLNSATDQFTKNLIKQKLSFAELYKQRKLAMQAYREQVRIQNMFVREAPSMGRGGKGLFDVAIPRQISQELNTVGERLRWINALVKSGSTQMINWGKNTQWAGRQLMVGFTVPTVAFGAATGALAFQVDKEMTRIKKVYDTTTVAVKGDSQSMAMAQAELAEVTEQAWKTAGDAAKNFGASATDTLKVQADLAATGLKGADLQKSTAEVMRIATLGELDYNDATTATIALQSAFKLSTTELAEAFNFMNATENATSLSIQDIVEATPRAATAMAQLGVSVEEMTVLLTSMREAGVDAAEGANALKSATGTILAPSPAAAAFITQVSNGTVAVDKLAQESGGNLYKALQLLYDQMEGLSDLQKQQILVKLFGKYQFNRVSAMVRNLGEAFDGTANQTKRAMDLMSQSTEQLANTADIELSKITESASGKFKIALEQIKMSLADVGEPFLEAGTQILGVIGDIISAFNKLPDGAKTFVAWGAIIAALIGPLVMLIGLSANFFGTIIKFGNALAALGRTTGIVTKETKAMELAAISAKTGWDQQTSAVMMLNEQLERLILSEKAAAASAAPYLTGRPVTGPFRAPPSQALQVQQMSSMWQNAVNSGPAIPNLGVAVREGEVLEKSTGKMAGYLARSAGSMGLMTAGMIATTASSNELVQSLGKVATFAGIGSMFGKGGLGLGIGAAIGGVMVLRDHLNDIYNETVENERALTNSTQLWANQADKVLRKFEAIQQASTVKLNTDAGDPESYFNALNRWQDKSMTDTLDAFNGLSGGDQSAFIIDKFIDLQNRLGLTAEQAGTEIRAMMVAAGKSFSEADIEATELLNTIGNIADNKDALSVQLAARIDLVDMDNPDTVYDTAKAVAEQFGEAFKDATSPQQAQGLIDQLTTSTNDMFAAAVKKLTPSTQEQFKELGINSIEAFTKAQDEGRINWADQQLHGMNPTDWMGEDLAKVKQYQMVLAQVIAQSAQLGDGWSDLSAVLDTVLFKSKVNTDEQNKALAISLATAGRLGTVFDSNAEAMTLTNLQTIAAAMGLKTAEDVATQLQYILDGVPPTIDQATGSAQELGNALSTALSGAFRFSGEDRKKMLQQGMSSLISDMASQASDNFSNRMDADLDALQESWNDRIDRQGKADDREQERFERRWDRRKKALTDAYDAQIAAIEKTSEKEQKQDDLRQKMFEAEMTRLERLADMANTNIDFNVALDSGKLDEAAKIQTNAMAQWQGWALQDAADASQDAADARQEKLENRIKALEEERDSELDDLEKREEQEKKHLDRVQELRMDALKDQEKAAMDSRKRAWELDKKSFDDRLNLFKSFTGRNMKDLKAWMDQTGFAYSDFGDKRLKPMGQDWAQYFRERLKDNIRIAGAQIASDNMWENMAGKEAAAILKGYGFSNMQQLARFIKTGKMPKNPPTDNNDGTSYGDDHRAPRHHEGGLVGSAKDSRKGVARTSGRHPSEQMILAQKGEYLINRKAAAKNKGILDGINNGEDMGGAGGSPGLFSALVGPMFMAGMNSAIGLAYKKGKKRQAGMSGFGAGIAGVYGQSGRAFSAEQLANAALIASVGRGIAGISNRDIEIGIMTAITESGLINVNHGDRDSLGLFQQRPSQGWGTPEQVTDPTYAASKFFNALKGVSGRATMAPWAAAQAVQRSAFSDGSNYRTNWDEALDIFKRGLTATGGTAAGYQAGIGGFHRPVMGGTPSSIHDSYTGFPAVDLAIPTGSKVYAPGDGRITRSEDIAGPLPSDRYDGDGPYGSYGRVIQMILENGTEVLFAHLSKRFVDVGAQVLGGAIIAASGNTGNSSGPHLHFGSSDGHPEAFFKKGGRVKGDGWAVVHDGETVVNKGHSKQFEAGIQTFSELQPGSFDPMAPGSQMVIDTMKKLNEAISTTKKGNVRTGTYNVLFSAPPEQTKADLGRLFGMTDVLSLTELMQNSPVIPWLRQKGWGITGEWGPKQDSAVVYNKAKIDAIGGGTMKMNNLLGESLSGVKGKGGARQMYAAYAHLKDLASGRSFWQIAAHTIAHIWKNPGLNRAVQQEQYSNLGGLATRLGSKGEPVFLGGDLNNTPGEPQWFKPLRDAGLVSNWNKETMRGQQGTHGNSFIDYVFSNAMAKLVSSKTVGGMSSDHNAVVTEFELPQLKTGGWTMSNGLAMLHEGEPVLTKELGSDLKRGIQNFADGGNSEYNFHIYPSKGMSEEELARVTVKYIQRAENRKPRGRKG